MVGKRKSVATPKTPANVATPSVGSAVRSCRTKKVKIDDFFQDDEFDQIDQFLQDEGSGDDYNAGDDVEEDEEDEDFTGFLNEPTPASASKSKKSKKNSVATVPGSDLKPTPGRGRGRKRKSATVVETITAAPVVEQNGGTEVSYQSAVDHFFAAAKELKESLKKKKGKNAKELQGSEVRDIFSSSANVVIQVSSHNF